MRKGFAVFMTVLIMGMTTGCGKDIYPELPENPAGFETGEYAALNDEDSGYRTIEYEGRLYIPYGTISGNLKRGDIDQCLGYIIQDGKKMSECRIYTLSSDAQHNYLMEYIMVGVMEQPAFLRAADTKGKEVFTPEFIESLGYEIWK